MNNTFVCSFYFVLVSFQTKTFLADKNGEDYTNWNFEVSNIQPWTLNAIMYL